MNRPAHVGDCPPMVFHAPARQGEGPIVVQPWEYLQTFADQLLQDSRWVRWEIRGEEPPWHLHWMITCANGWAIYRRVGYDRERRVFIGELVDSEYEPIGNVDATR